MNPYSPVIIPSASCEMDIHISLTLAFVEYLCLNHSRSERKTKKMFNAIENYSKDATGLIRFNFYVFYEPFFSYLC